MILQTLNKEVLKNHKELWDEIKNKIVTINDGKASEYGKKPTKIKFDTDDDLPLNKLLKLHMLTLVDLFLKRMVNFIPKFI